MRKFNKSPPGPRRSPPGLSQAKFELAGTLHQQGKLAEAERALEEILKQYSKHFDALHLLGIIAIQTGRMERGVELIGNAIGVNAKVAAAHSNLGYALSGLRRHEEAIASLNRAIALDRNYAAAYVNLGNALQDVRRFEEAVANYDRAIALKPDSAEAHGNRGNALKNLDRLQDALASYDKAIAARPGYAQAYNNRAVVLRSLKCPAESLASCDKAITLKPNSADAQFNRGNALLDLDRLEEALASYDKAVALKPGYAEAYNNRGTTLLQLKRAEEALASYGKAISLKPDDPEAHNNRGNALLDLKRAEDAVASYDKAIRLDPAYPEAYHNRGNALLALNRSTEALASYDKAVSIKPDYAEAHYKRGNALALLKRPEQALASYKSAISCNPELNYAEGNRFSTKLQICDWMDLESETAHLLSAVRNRKPASLPFAFLALPSTPAEQLQCAESFTGDQLSTPSIWRGGHYDHGRIRVAYLSADFHEHATAYLMAGLFELHDKVRFEVTALSFGPNQHSEIRDRLKNSFEHFIDVRSQSDHEIAELIHGREIDIAIDLKGFTENMRANILTRRPAPIQVSYLGFPATMGASHIDYIIADATVIPEAEFAFYREQVVWLPDTYWVSDSKYRIADRTPTRQDCGLPETAFVFCCFNNTYKITPGIFDIWMRLLRATEGSVLWLIEANSTAPSNLRREAEQRGVSSERLIFAPRMASADHLARHRQADLVLDTLPYNAHTTATDALWAGVPVLTCLGSAFAGRVAASVLRSVGLADLVTTSREHYESLALKLAHDAPLLASIKDRLARNRNTYPLFDTKRFARHIETAYTVMWERHQRGEQPQSFAVAPIAGL